MLVELLELKKKDSTSDQEWDHDGGEDDKENDEVYRSCDKNDDGSLLDEDDDDYVD